jgi:putative membrane protein
MAKQRFAPFGVRDRMRPVEKVIVKVLVNAVAILVAAAVLDGVRLVTPGETLGRKVLTLIVVGAIFGLVNAVVKPIVKLFSLPFYILTLGLFAFIVNAVMLEIVSWISDKLNISFHIDHFLSALGAAVIVALVSLVLNLAIPD